MRHIEMLSAAIARVVLRREPREFPPLEEDHSGANDPLVERLTVLLAQHKVNEAEQVLFDTLDETGAFDPRMIDAALWFYRRLSEWTDDDLAKADWRRDEILEGLQALAERYSITVK